MQMPDNKPIDFGTYLIIAFLLALVIVSLVQFLGN